MSLKKHHIKNFVNSGGKNYPDIELSYEVFGKKLGSAPVVLVNHALTGNSDVTSRNKGWWKEIVGADKLIDLNRFTVIAFNVLGNGYDETYIHNYKNFSASDMAKLFLTALDDLGVAKLFAAIGGSLGGCIAWEMVALRPKLIEHLIPIAANFQANDWIIAHCFVQERILANSSNNIEDARIMAMLFYRSAASFRQKFNRSLAENEFQYNVESWLDHHGRKLRLRYTRHAYLMTNHLLRSVNILKDATFKDVIEPIESTIIQIGIDTDIFFVPEEMTQTQIWLDQLGKKNSYHEIKSIHGHDGFLIENDQITTILSPIFKQDIK